MSETEAASSPEISKDHPFTHAGRCPVCEQPAIFRAEHAYFRNSLRCSNCGTLPRHRALMHVLSMLVPDWRQKTMHESSPGWDSLSRRFAQQCPQYIASHFDATVPPGTWMTTKLPCRRFITQDLEQQTFTDECFDIVIAQDVFEHLFRPDLAFREISRTLRPGGVFVSTVPIVRKQHPSRRRANLADGQISYLLPAEYHGNPINEKGSLVTFDWGYDIAVYCTENCGLPAMLFQIDNIDLGIRAHLTDVLVCFKSRANTP